MLQLLPDPEFLDPLEWERTPEDDTSIANGLLTLGGSLISWVLEGDWLVAVSSPIPWSGQVVPTNAAPVDISARYSYEIVVTEQQVAGTGSITLGGVTIWEPEDGVGVHSGRIFPDTEEGLVIALSNAHVVFGRVSIMAANTDIKALALREIRVHVPDATYNVVMDAFLKASREFCRRTLAWRDTVTVAIAQGETNKQIYDPVTAVVVDVFSSKLDNEIRLSKKTVAQIDAIDPELLTKQDTPDYVYLGANRNTVNFAPIPASAHSFTTEVALMPTEAITVIDDHLWDRYGEAIISGTLYRLFRMPRKPWSDANLAIAHRNEFEAAIPEARSMAADGHMVGVARKARYGGV